MADSVATVDVAAASVPSGASPAAKKSKSAVAASKKPRVKPAHPPTAEMVNSAITTLKERGGSSLQAIKKYLSSNYKIDAEKLAPFIKKYLRSAVVGGQLIQTKGKGATGSFKLAAKEVAAAKSAAKKVKKVTEKKPKTLKKVVATVATKKKTKAVVAKKTGDAKKTVDKKKAAVATAKVAKKSASVKAAKSPKQKPTKATKTVAKKPKTPKPKKVTATKKAATATKKVAAPKKK